MKIKIRYIIIVKKIDSVVIDSNDEDEKWVWMKLLTLTLMDLSA